MSRSGYVDFDGDEYDGLRASGWAANVRRCIRGKHGQRFLWELYLALESLPTKELITDSLRASREGAYCSLGAVALARGMDVSAWTGTESDDDDDWDDDGYAEAMGPLFGIKDMLAREIMYQNDEADNWHWEDTGQVIKGGVRHGDPRKYRTSDTPAERWQRMRRWVVSRLRDIP